MYWLRALSPGILAAVLTMALTPLAVRIAWRLRAVDVPDGRRRHDKVTPRLGGIAITAALVISLVPALLLLGSRGAARPALPEMLWFLAATLIIFTLGVVDDLKNISPLPKLLVQILAASIVVIAVGWQFSAIRLPWEGKLSVIGVAPLLSVLWIVGVTNAINFIDGLDGLAAGLVGIMAGSLLLFSIFQRDPEAVIASSCIVGCCAGFLRHNWRPAKIFMGDSGSLTLGFVLATISLRSGVKASAAIAILVPLLALGVPVLDTLMVIWYRFLRGHQHMNRLARIVHADRRHLHHLLHESQSERPTAIFILYGLAGFFCLMALIVAASGSVWLGLGFLGVEFAVILLIRKAGLNAAARRLAESQLKELDENGEEKKAEPEIAATESLLNP